MIDKNIQAWSQKDSVNFYARERTCVADLYESESSMLLPVVSRVRSVLDVGCAIGNFYSIFKELNPRITYTGIDVAEGMIEEARRRHPGVAFHLGNGRKLPFDNDAFDLVSCMGVLHHNPDYLAMVEEIFRVTRRFAVIDLPRLVTQPYAFDMATSYMELESRLSAKCDGDRRAMGKVPYVLANVRELFENLLPTLSETLSGIACQGYYGTMHKSIKIPYSSAIFTVVLLVKGKGSIRYCLNLPDDARRIAEAALSAKGIRVESVKEVITAEREEPKTEA